MNTDGKLAILLGRGECGNGCVWCGMSLDKKYDEAEKIVDILDKKTNGYADGISKARILISRGKRREAN